MAHRLWGLNRRQTIGAFVSVVAISLAVGLLLGRGGGSGSGGGGVERIAPGTPASPHAVWVFGFETLRFDRALGVVGRLPVQGFGDVHGTEGRVDLYDPVSGRIGALATAQNRLREVARVPAGASSDDVFVPTIADVGPVRWLVIGPGTLRRVALATHDVGLPVAVASDSARPIATGVVAAGAAVFAATRDETGLALARVDSRTQSVTVTAHVQLPDGSTLDGLATDGARLWVLAANTAYELESATLGVVRSFAVTGRTSGAVRGAVVAGGAVWFLADNGASLVRLDDDATSVALKILPEVPASFRTPAGLVASGGRVFGMVQRGGSDPGDHRVRIVGYDAVRARPTRGVDLPSTLFAGEIAAT